MEIPFVCQNFMGNKGQFLLLLSLSEAHRIFGFTSVGCININSCANTKGVDGKGGAYGAWWVSGLTNIHSGTLVCVILPNNFLLNLS